MGLEDPDSDPDHSQNLIISSFYLFRHFLKIPSKSVNKFSILFTDASGSLDPDDPDSDPDHSQNLITCFLSHLGHFLKIS